MFLVSSHGRALHSVKVFPEDADLAVFTSNFTSFYWIFAGIKTTNSLDRAIDFL